MHHSGGATDPTDALHHEPLDALVDEIKRRGAPPWTLHDRAMPGGLMIQPGHASMVFRGHTMRLRPKAIEVLCRLADVYPSGFTRDALALVIWPYEVSDEARRANLRTAVWTINRQTRAATGIDLVMTSYRVARIRGSCWLNLCGADGEMPEARADEKGAA